MMEPNARFRRNVRAFYAYLGSLVLAGLAPIAAGALVERDGTAWHVAGVAIGVLGWVPMLFMITRIIAFGDEFARRIHLVAAALSFAGALVIIALLDWLARAGFIARVPLMLVWVLMSVLWVVCLIAVNRHYSRVQ